MAQGAIEEILATLAAAEVRFVVAGGVAVVLQGHPRFTADLDLALDLDGANVRRAMAVLEGLGFRPQAPVAAEALADPTTRARWIAEKGMRVFSLSSDRFRGTDVDLFTSDPIEFDELWREAARFDLGGVAVAVASIRHLIAMKRAAGRGKDIEDIEALERIAAEGESAR